MDAPVVHAIGQPSSASAWADPEFFEQLTSEVAEPIVNARDVRVGARWTKRRARNEVLDLMVYNFAAREIRSTLDLDRYGASVGLPPRR